MGTSNSARICQCCILLVLIGLIGCGGGNGQLFPVPEVPSDIPTLSGFKVVGSGNTSQAKLDLVTTRQDGQVLVQVVSGDQQELDSLFFELEYDESLFTPVSAQASEVIAPLAESLCIEILNVPGLVSCGQAPLTTSVAAIEAGVVLAEVLFRNKPFDKVTVSTETQVPQNNNALSPLVWDEDSGMLQWYMVNPGDYNQDGMVGISDLTPLAANFGMAGPFSFFSAQSAIDGHSDGDINISDITPIVLYWNNYIEGFNLYASTNLEDIPTAHNEPSEIAPLATFSLADAEGAAIDERIWFSYTPLEGEPGLYYWVRPFDGETEGTRSNLMSPEMDSSAPIGNTGEGFNLAPMAMLNLDYIGTTVPLDVTFDASGSSDPDGVIALYEWDFEGDGLFDSYSTNPVVSHTFWNVGTYAPLVRVSDNGGLWDTFQSPPFVVEEGVINNILPIADIFPTAASGELPFTVGLIATGSTDIDGYITKYEWDFDADGIFEFDSGTDPTVMYTYTTSGLKAPQVQVTDNRGGSAIASVQITATAENQAPVAVLNANFISGIAPLAINFDARGSFDYDGSIVEFAWDWNGDGIFDGVSLEGNVPYTYLTEGAFNATVRVEDDKGSWGTETLLITVGPPVNNPPIADLETSALGGFAPLVIDFNAGGSYDTDGSIVEYAWDWNGDGIYDGITFTPLASYTFTSAGSPEVRVRVMDNEGAGGVASLTIDINVPGNAPPTASLTAFPGLGDYPLLVTLDASGSNDPDGAITGYEWDFDGDGIYDFLGTNDSEDYTYLDEGTFYPKVRVTDNVGAQSTDSSMVRVHVEDWTMFGHDLQHTSQSWSTGPQTFDPKWNFDTDGGIWSSPVIGPDGTVYVGSIDDNLYAINPDGSEKWSFDTGDTVVAPPAVALDGTVYIGSWNDRLYAVNPDGSQKWSFVTGANISAGPTVDTDGTIYIGSSDTVMYAINPNGSEKWNYTTDGNCRSTVAISPGGTLYFGNDAGSLYALNPDGTLDWVNPIGAGISSSPSITATGTILFGCNDGNLYSLNPDGTLDWTYLTGGSVTSSPAIAFDGTIYIGSNDRSLHAVNPDGSGKWTYLTGNMVRCSPTIGFDGTIYVGSYDFTLHAINPDGSPFWTLLTSGNVLSSPAISQDGTLYFGSNDSRLFALGGT